MITLDIEPKFEAKREQLYQQIMALKTVLKKEYIPEIVFEENFTLDNGKTISRIYVQLDEEFNIYNKNTWRNAFQFFNKNMPLFELWFYEFEDFIKQANN